MSDVFEKAEELAGHVKEYVNLKVDAVKLTVAEKTSSLVANLAAGIVVAVMILFVVIFASIAGAIALSEWLANPWAGFLIVAGIYLLIGIITWAGRGRLIRFPVMNAIIQQLYSNDNDKEDEKD